MRFLHTLCLFVLSVLLFISCNSFKGNSPIKLLILSGSNNHEWQETTSYLNRIFQESGNFETEITNQPDTLSCKYIKQFDAIVSNWNSWPENDLRWDKDLENGILNYLNEGGGLVFFHASTSVFYQWPEFRKITTASWEENTSHGKRDTVEVYITDRSHPITKGLKDFKLFDELWVDARQNTNVKVLGSATDKTQKEKGNISQPAIFVKEVGKGRIFHTIIGHDVEAMSSNGFKKLMLRGTEWAANGKVKNH